MANGWTAERRARQAALIRNWRPWEESTGPRTTEGKAASSRNGDRGGVWRELKEFRRLVNKLLREQRAACERLRERNQVF